MSLMKLYYEYLQENCFKDLEQQKHGHHNG